LIALLVVQVGSGLSNVLLDWPLLAALLHTAGAAALVALLMALACRLPTTRPIAQPALERRWQRGRA
jgi:cytochrome c oxidase assembly protein subunit 15